MKNLLVPVGTSKNTVSHLQYAVDFAEAFGAKLYVVHIYKVFTKAGTMINLDHILERESKEYLRDLMSKIDTKNVAVINKTEATRLNHSTKYGAFENSDALLSRQIPYHQRSTSAHKMCTGTSLRRH